MKKIICLFVIGLLLVTGCAKKAAENKTGETNTGQKTAAETTSKVNIAATITKEWQGSAHAKAVGAADPKTAPGLRAEGGCFFCHNGYAFENEAKDLQGIGILKGTSCDTCHVGYGQKLMTAGKADLPIGMTEGGKGIMCSRCHNGRGKKPDLKSAPHASVQVDMLKGKSGAEVSGVSYGNSGHASLPESCLSCHMAKDKNGLKDHTFKMNAANIDQSCNKCHKFTSFNPEAKADYDGNGKKEGIQTEVQGLLKVLQPKIVEKLNGGKFVSEHGSIVFQDAKGKALTTPPDKKVYNAVWNYLFVDADGSKGIHNTRYAVQLLQQSYKELTGSDVPKAEILK